VEFTTKNVAEDEEAIAGLERRGTMTTPVTVVDDEEVVVGFDRKKLGRPLGLNIALAEVGPAGPHSLP
jgi:hypothetical protein